MDFIVAVGWGSRSEEAREVVTTTVYAKTSESSKRSRTGNGQFRAWESRNCISTSTKPHGTSVLTKLQLLLHQDGWRPIASCSARLLLVLPYGVHHLPIQKDRQSTTITAYLSRVSSRVLLGNLRLIVIAHSSLFPFFPFSKLYLGL